MYANMFHVYMYVYIHIMHVCATFIYIYVCVYIYMCVDVSVYMPCRCLQVCVQCAVARPTADPLMNTATLPA